MNERRQPPQMRMPGSRGMGGMAGMGEKAKDFKNTVFKIWDYLKEYKLTIVTIIIFALFSTVFSIIGPKLLGKVTTKLVEGLFAYYSGRGLSVDMKYLETIIVWLIILYVVSSLCMYIQGYMMSKVSMEVTYKLRKNISEKMFKVPLNYYDTRTHGEVLSRITNDIDTVNQTLNQSLLQIITSVTSVVGILAMMFSISLIMTIAALVIIPLSMGIMAIVFRKSQGFFRSQQKSIGEMNGHVEEIYSGHNIVKAFNGEDDALQKFIKINDELYGSAWKSQFVSSMMMPIMGFVGNMGFVTISILGGYLAVKRLVEIGDIQAFIQYMRSFTQPIAQLASVSNTLQSTVAAAERVFEFLEEKEESADTDKIVEIKEFHGNVTFENVSFGYPLSNATKTFDSSGGETSGDMNGITNSEIRMGSKPHRNQEVVNPQKIIIRNFSEEIKAGQKVAIVGPTGAGKTTIVKLLMRFYDINSGRILIDGVDIFDLKRTELRGLFGMVLQDTWLYNASIMENIRYGSFNATDEHVAEAAKAAHCDEFIRTLPGGYNMVLNEEADNISQGQKQLFTIARAILSNPKILILDEATSSVDTRTELLIQKAMDNLMKGRTTFVIAHRLSTIKNSDLILVMQEGNIVEQGNHSELRKMNGVYADIYNSQFSHESVDSMVDSIKS